MQHNVNSLTQRQYISVSKVNAYIKRILHKNPDLKKIYVRGEISNFRRYPTGTCYFTLKDEKSEIGGIMFRNYSKYLKFEPKNGMKVLIRGEISVYDVKGTYKIAAHKISPDGLGDLHLAFEQLKKKLQKEGLFEESIKKELPKYPKRIGVVTASTGAAIKDIITTIERRWPLCEVLLFPSLVQGDNAALSIVNQIKRSENYNLDTLIIGRGGGSIEDLWAFNEEIVARAIFECKTPVISAVGHDVDYTIADFVADVRAPTPTAAGEYAVPNLGEIQNKLNLLNRQANQFIKLKFNDYKRRFENLIDRNILKNPDLIYRNKQLKLDDLLMKLNFESKDLISVKKNKLFELRNSFVFKNPDLLYLSRKRDLDDLVLKLHFESKDLISSNRNKLFELKNSFIFRNPLIMVDNKSREYSEVKLHLARNSEVLLNKKANDLKKYKDSYVLSNPNNIIDKKSNKLLQSMNKLEVLNPLHTVKRGYTLTKKEGKVVSSSKDLKKGDKLEVEFKDGSVNTEVI